jgi:hypothetical protein
MRKFKEVVFNAVIYRGLSVIIQLVAVFIIFGLTTNWKIVAICNLLCFTWYICYHMTFIKIKRKLKHEHANNRIIRAYLSHPIRGSKNSNASKDQQLINSQRAIEAAEFIRKFIPNLQIYCPGHAERFVHYTYADKLLTDAQILDIDCKIINECDVLLVYDFDKSAGVKIEIEYAVSRGIPVLRFKELNGKTIDDIREFINSEC